MIPQGMVCSCTVAEAIAAAVPHHVLPQLLRPMVTAMVPADAVLRSMTTLHDARGYASSVMVWPPSPEDTAAIVACFDALRSLSKCHTLSVRVELPSLPVIARQLRELASVIQVTSLSLSCTTTLDTALPEVSTCDGDSATSTSPGLLPRSITSLGNLTTLRIGRCGSADATFCESVGKLRKLTSLSLCQADPIDAAAFGAHIAPLPITNVCVENCTTASPILPWIVQMTELATLSMTGCRDLCLSYAHNTTVPEKTLFGALTSLDLGSCLDISGSLAAISMMSILRSLNLRHCDVRDEDFDLLSNLVRLEELDLGMWIAGVDADTIEAVARAFPALRRLGLMSNDSLRDDGVGAVAAIRALEWVDLRECYGITVVAVRRLQMQRRSLTIESRHTKRT